MHIDWLTLRYHPTPPALLIALQGEHYTLAGKEILRATTGEVMGTLHGAHGGLHLELPGTWWRRHHSDGRDPWADALELHAFMLGLTECETVTCPRIDWAVELARPYASDTLVTLTRIMEARLPHSTVDHRSSNDGETYYIGTAGRSGGAHMRAHPTYVRVYRYAGHDSPIRVEVECKQLEGATLRDQIEDALIRAHTMLDGLPDTQPAPAYEYASLGGKPTKRRREATESAAQAIGVYLSAYYDQHDMTDGNFETPLDVADKIAHSLALDEAFTAATVRRWFKKHRTVLGA